MENNDYVYQNVRHRTTKMQYGVYICSNTINCVNCKTLEKSMSTYQVHTEEKGDMSQTRFPYFNRNRNDPIRLGAFWCGCYMALTSAKGD